MTERDTFAAGALAGLLAGGVQFRGDEERDKFCAAVWKLADAMLAARGDKPTAPASDALFHAALVLYEAGRWVSPDVPAVQAVAMWATLRDALGLPAGYATDRGVADAAAGEPDGGEGTGDTRAAQEPVAWAVYYGDELIAACTTPEVAAAYVRAWPERYYRVVPLYAAPPAAGVTFTDAEQQTLWFFHAYCDTNISKARLDGELTVADLWQRKRDIMDGLLTRACGQTSGQESLAQRQSSPESTPACDAQEPAKQAVTLTDAERRELDAAASEYESGAEKIVYGRDAYRRRAATLRGLLARVTKEGR
jgi:hypothetical protein